MTTVFDHWSQTHCMDSLSLFPATKKNPMWKCNSARCEPTRSKERAHTRVATIMFWWDFRGGRWSRIPRPGGCFPHFPKRSRRFPAPGEGPGVLGAVGSQRKVPFASARNSESAEWGAHVWIQWVLSPGILRASPPLSGGAHVRIVSPTPGVGLTIFGIPAILGCRTCSTKVLQV